MHEQDCEQLTFFQGDSPVNRSPLPGSAEARKMTVTSGRKCSELSKSCGPLGLLEKMLLESSIWRSTRCYLNWKPKATKQGRLLFQLAVSTPRIEGTGSPLWLGTMTASQTGGNHSLRSPERRKGRAPSPAEFVMMWPTPTSREYKGGRKPETLKAKGRTPSNTLCDAVNASLFPTPTSRCGTSPGNTKTRQGGKDLQTEVGGQLNPAWVEWLMGFPIGWTDLKD